MDPAQISWTPCTWSQVKKVPSEDNPGGPDEYRPCECAGPRRQFVKLVKDKFEKFILHEWLHQWNGGQLQRMTIADQSHLPFGMLSWTRDFAMNHTFHDVLEPQSAWFSYRQLTLLPMIVTRHAVLPEDGEQSTPENPRLVEEYVVLLSSYHGHDNLTAQHADKALYEHYVSRGYPVKGTFKSSDCGPHFRVCHEWLHLSQFQSKPWNTMKVPHMIGHSAACHGSGRVDVCGFACKNSMRVQEPKGTSPKCAQEATPWLRQEFAKPKTTITGKRRSHIHRWDFLWAIREDMIPIKPAETVDGTLKIHQAKASALGPGYLDGRAGLCTCRPCLFQAMSDPDPSGAPCENAAIMSQLNRHAFGQAVPWHPFVVNAVNLREDRELRARGEELWEALGADVKVGEHVCILSVVEEEHGGVPYYIGRVVRRRRRLEEAQTVLGAAAKEGDYVVTIRWLDLVNPEHCLTDYTLMDDPPQACLTSMLRRILQFGELYCSRQPSRFGEKAVYTVTPDAHQKCVRAIRGTG